MSDKSQNIVSETLKSKLEDLDLFEQRIDANYSRDKKAITEQKRQIQRALELINLNEKEISAQPPEKRGRKAAQFDPLNYPFDGSFNHKVLFAISQFNRFSHVREIAKYLTIKEPSIVVPGFVDLIGRRIWKLKNSGKVAQYKEGTSLRNIFYGLPEWLDNNGKIKNGFEFDKAALTDKISKPERDMFEDIK